MHKRSGKRLHGVASSDAVDLTKITLKTLLQAVVEASDVFPPLKSVAAGLNFIVENAQTVKANKADMESLLRRMSRLSELPRLDDDEELRRREVLEKELENIRSVLSPIKKRNAVRRFVEASHTAALIQEYVRQITRALEEYQVSLLQDLYKLNIEQTKRDEINTLDKLLRAKDAGFDTSDYRSRCLSGTREDVLRDLRVWANDTDTKQIYWLNGHAGSGKSTIAQSFAEMLSSDGKLGASFFCSRYSQSRSDVKMMFPTISFQLGMASHAASLEFRKAVLHALETNPDIASLSLQNQLDELIIAPAKKSGMATIVVIDALDECKDEATTSIILSFLAQNAARFPAIKFFITSRPEPHIRAGFRLEPLMPITDVMILHEVASTSVAKDIRLFLEKKLTDPSVRAQRSDLDLPVDWPSQDEIDGLAKKASGLFIYASTAVKLILDKDNDPRGRLHALLSSADTFAEEGPSGLDTLYLDILTGAFPGKSEQFLRELRTILGFLVVSCDLVPAFAVAEILDVAPSNVKTFLRSLHSLLLVPEDLNRPIRFHHKSFPDFLANSRRCTDKRFYVSRSQHNFETAAYCFDLMERRLKRNMCSLPRYTMNNSPGTNTRIVKHISQGTRYCCQYWANHLVLANDCEEHVPVMNLLLRRFLATRQLQWLEALSLLQNLPCAVDTLTIVRQLFTSRHQSYQTLLDMVVDGHKFILKAFDVISVSAAHIYHSALVFTPETSLLKTIYDKNLANEATVLVGGETSWTGPIRTIQPKMPVLALEYSHSGTLLAGSGDHFTSLFRSGTGEKVDEFSSAACQTPTLSISHDDRMFATVFDDSIDIWDICTGAKITSFPNPDDASIASIAFHPDLNRYLVLRHDDGHIRLWDIEAQEVEEPFLVEDTIGEVCWLRRSGQMIILVGSYLASGCVHVWDVKSRLRLKTLTPPLRNGCVTAIASSRDGSLVASGSQFGVLVIYDADSGTPVHRLSNDYSQINSLQFSPTYPDMLIFAAGLAVHVFYPDRVTNRVTALTAHRDVVNIVAFSQDGRFVASGSDDCTINIWEAGSEDVDLHKDNHHSSTITCASFSADGRLLVSGSHDTTIRLWDTSSGILLRVFQALGYSSSTRHVTILSDNLHIVSCDVYGNTILWNRQHSEPLAQGCVFSGLGSVIDSSIFPYTHYPLGFFYCATNNYQTERVEAWTVVRCSTTSITRMVLVAQGSIPEDEFVTGISHRESQEASNTTLVVKCKSGKLLLATWRNAITVPDTMPANLHFVEEGASEQSQGTIEAERACMSVNMPCQLSDDEAWVIDERGQNILWVPAVNRGFGIWHGKKLALAGKSGRLTLVDFSRAGLRLNNEY